MTTIKNKMIASIALLSIALMSTLLPFALTITALFSMALIASIHFVTQNYQINYKYCFSFAGQLIGLVLIVASFVLVFIATTSLIIQ